MTNFVWEAATISAQILPVSSANFRFFCQMQKGIHIWDSSEIYSRTSTVKNRLLCTKERRQKKITDYKLLVKNSVETWAKGISRMDDLTQFRDFLVARVDFIMLFVKHGLILGVIECVDGIWLIFFLRQGWLLVLLLLAGRKWDHRIESVRRGNGLGRQRATNWGKHVDKKKRTGWGEKKGLW